MSTAPDPLIAAALITNPWAGAALVLVILSAAFAAAYLQRHG